MGRGAFCVDLSSFDVMSDEVKDFCDLVDGVSYVYFPVKLAIDGLKAQVLSYPLM